MPLGEWGDEKGEQSVEMTNICYVTYETVNNGKVKMIKIKFSVLSESYFSPDLTQAGHFVKNNQVSGMVISYTCVFVIFFINFSAHSSELLKGFKIMQSKISQIPPDYIKTNVLLDEFRNSLIILHFESIYIIIYSELFFPYNFCYFYYLF